MPLPRVRPHSGLVIAVAASLWLLPDPFAHTSGAASAQEIELGAEIVLAPAGPSPRRLRADFEPIDVLALVHTPDWEGALQTIIEAVGDEVDVHLLTVEDDAEARRFRRWARRRGVRVTYMEHDTPWIRDYGPMQVFEGGLSVWADYGYSDDRRLDDGLPVALGEAHGAPMDVEQLSLDGGGVVSDGEGLCVATDYTIDDTGLDRSDHAALEVFLARLGCRAMAIVPRLDVEETGHIDLAVQFLAPDRVAVAEMEPNEFPQQAAALDATARAIAEAARQLGRPMHIVRMPMRAQGEIFYSYLNGTRVGGLFLVPSYGNIPVEDEAAAHGILAASMPGVKLVPIPADAMVELGGAIHCITVGLNLHPRAHPNLPPHPHRRRAPRRRVRRS